VVLGGLDHRELQVAEELSVRGQQGQVDRAVLWDCRIGKAFGDALTMGLVGHLLADGRQVVLRGGIGPMR
jgi:hypothetical protein